MESMRSPVGREALGRISESISATEPSMSRLNEFAQTFVPLRLPDILHDRPAEGAFVRAHPFAFLVGLIADQNVRVETAWSLPYRLSIRLGFFDPKSVAELDESRVASIVAERPALHRYPGVMGPRVVSAAKLVFERYEGDAGRIWRSGQPAIAVAAALSEFPGVGPKKASLGAQMAMRDLGEELTDVGGLEIAIDSHIRRVLHRYWGQAADDSELRSLARRKAVGPPSALTPPVWVIGREWCKPRRPLCQRCPLHSDCQAVTLQVARAEVNPR